jgi:hypothetical protein
MSRVIEGVGQTASYVKEDPAGASVKLVNAGVEFGGNVLDGEIHAVGQSLAAVPALLTGAGGKLATGLRRFAPDVSDIDFDELGDAYRAAGRGGFETTFRDIGPEGGGTYFDIVDIKERGVAIENALGKNTPDTFETFDRITESGEAVSIKSFDLASSSSYNKPGAKQFEYALRAYARDASDFTGARVSGFRLDATDIRSRSLEVAVQRGSVTPDQYQALRRAAEYARQLDNPVHLRVIEIR